MIVGDSALQCPNCKGAITRSIHPPEADLPFRLTGDAAVFIIFLFAWLIAEMLSPLFPVAPTVAALGFLGITGLVIHLLYLYKIKLASYPIYRVAQIREIEPWKPKS